MSLIYKFYRSWLLTSVLYEVTVFLAMVPRTTLYIVKRSMRDVTNEPRQEHIFNNIYRLFQNHYITVFCEREKNFQQSVMRKKK